MTTEQALTGSRISRRKLLVGGAAATGVDALGAIGGFEFGALTGQSRQTDLGANPTPGSTNDRMPFDGAHQAGIVTPAQDRLAFAAFDVIATSRADLGSLLGTWTSAARQMAAGLPVGDVGGAPLQPPVDTGEALGLGIGRLTITVGFGPGLFDGRFGLSGQRPQGLIDLPAFPGDVLEPTRVGGDLCIQACSDDPQVSFHAVRNLARLARGLAEVRWFQLGFGRTSSTSSAQVTPRNLMGFKDGTNNIVAEEGNDVDQFVWVGGTTDQAWMQNDPRTGFVEIQSRLAAQDSLNEYIRHTGSAIFACPPGTTSTSVYWGSGLLG